MAECNVSVLTYISNIKLNEEEAVNNAEFMFNIFLKVNTRPVHPYTISDSNGTIFSSQVEMSYFLNQVKEKCPNLFVVTGTQGKEAAINNFDNTETPNLFNNEANPINTAAQNDIYIYGPATLYKWGQDANKKLLLSLIYEGSIKLTLQLLSTAKFNKTSLQR